MADTIHDRGRTLQVSNKISQEDAQKQIDALRKELALLSNKARDYSQHVAKSVVDTTSDAAVGVKSTIRKHPTTSMAVAVGAGAVLAMLLAPRPAPPRSRYQKMHSYMPDMSGYSLAIERALNRAAPTENLAAVGSRIADAVGEADIGSNLSTAAERVMRWWDDTRKQLAERKVGK